MTPNVRRRGIGSNQYVDKAPGVEQIDAVNEIRRLEESFGKTVPSSSISEFASYRELEDANKESLSYLSSGEFDRTVVERNARRTAIAEDKILFSNPNAYGLAMINAAKKESVYQVSGEESEDETYAKNLNVLYANMQGEHVEDEDLANAIRDFSGIGEEVSEIPLYLATSSNRGATLEEKLSSSNNLRRSMAEARSKAILG